MVLPKKDVKEAFRWVPMHEEDTCLFGTGLDSQKWGIPSKMVAIYLVLSLGWTGSPGEWMVWVWLCK